MKTSNIKIRPCLPQDDITDIALCLYQTDPYIYPHICNGDFDIWRALVEQCLDIPNNIFSRDNLSVAAEGKSIYGIACVITGGNDYRFIDSLVYPQHIADNIKNVQHGYFTPTLDENIVLNGFNLISFCTRNDKRRLGIGQSLMKYLIEKYNSKDIYLETIADNNAAISLYEKNEFKLLETRNGFRPDGAPLPCAFYCRKKT